MMKNTQHKYRGKAGKIGERLAGMSVYAKIFAVLALVLFVFGACMLGAFNGTGGGVTFSKSDRAVSLAYRLSYEEEQSLAAVYVNVGTVYAEAGATRSRDTLQLRVSRYSGTAWSAVGSAVYIANLYAGNDSSAYKSNANYNWTAIVEGRSLTDEYVRVTVLENSASAQINEVAFVDGNGELIGASVAESFCDGVTRSAAARTLDAQGSFSASSSLRHRFTYQEEYILESIDGVELGGEGNQDNVYVMSSDYNALGILVYALFTWIFGKSTFGLRLPSFLSAFGIFLVLFFLGRKLFRHDKWGLVAAGLFALGGGLYGLGMTGTPAALALFAAVLGIFFMYRFFSEGVPAARPVAGALPVLFSGVSSAVAFAIDTMAVFPCLVSLLLFVCGLLRLYDQRAYLAAKAQEADGASVSVSAAQSEGENEGGMPANTAETAAGGAGSSADGGADDALGHALARIDREYRRKLRAAAGWFACAVAVGVLLVLLAAVPLYPAFVRFYGGGSFFDMAGRGILQCLTAGDVTPYTAGNASTPWGWFVALGGALLYEGGGGAAAYALPNFVMAYVAAAAFLFCTVYLALAARRHWGEKRYMRALRAYIGLTLGVCTGLLPYLFDGLVSMAQSGAFYLFYFTFIVLAFYIFDGMRRKGGDEAEKRGAGAARRSKCAAADIVLLALFVLFFIVFVLGMPAVFGWEVGAAGQYLFGWMSPVWSLPAV